MYILQSVTLVPRHFSTEMENSSLIKSLGAKEGDPNSPTIHLHPALTATGLLIINTKDVMVHRAAEHS